MAVDKEVVTRVILPEEFLSIKHLILHEGDLRPFRLGSFGIFCLHVSIAALLSGSNRVSAR